MIYNSRLTSHGQLESILSTTSGVIQVCTMFCENLDLPLAFNATFRSMKWWNGEKFFSFRFGASERVRLKKRSQSYIKVFKLTAKCLIIEILTWNPYHPNASILTLWGFTINDDQPKKSPGNLNSMQIDSEIMESDVTLWHARNRDAVQSSGSIISW